MAAGKWKLYDTAKELIGDNTIDLDNDTFKMALFTSASNCNTLTDGNTQLSNLTNQVANGNGYTTGGVTLTGVTWNRSGGTVTFNFNAPTWTGSGSGFTCRYAVIYDDTSANDRLLAVCLLDTTPGNITVAPLSLLQIENSPSGCFTVSGAAVD